MADTARPPRVPPSTNSMAARVAAAPANRRSLTQAQEFALLYRRANALNDDMDAAGFRREVPGLREAELALWPAVNAAARTVLMQKPETQADLLLQLSIISGWMETVIDSIDGEDALGKKMAQAISDAIMSATLFLRKDVPTDALSPEIAEFIPELLQMAVLDDPLAERQAA